MALGPAPDPLAQLGGPRTELGDRYGRADAQVQAGEWAWRFVVSLVKGLNLALPGEALEDDELSWADGVRVEQGKVIADTGFTAMGLAISAYLGTPRRSWFHQYKNGTNDQLLFCDNTAARYASGPKQWQVIAGWDSVHAAQAALVTNLITNAGGTAFQTATNPANVGFAAGNVVGVTLDDGSQLITTIVSITGAGPYNVNTTDGVPVGRNAPNGTTLVRGPVFSGAFDHQHVCKSWPAIDGVVFTNGHDTPQKVQVVNGIVTSQPLGGLSYTANAVTYVIASCRVLALFGNLLFMLDTTENVGGAGLANYPQRVRRSDFATADVWNETVGLAGRDDLLNKSDFITAAETLGDYLIIYRQKEIVRGEYLGIVNALTGNQVMYYRSMVTGEGALCPRAVLPLEDVHLVLGQTSLYVYRGGQARQIVQKNISSYLYGPTGLMSQVVNALSQSPPVWNVISYWDRQRREAWFMFLDPGGNNRLLRWKADYESWATRSFEVGGLGVNAALSSVDESQQFNGVQIQNLVGTIAAQVGTILSYGSFTSSPVPLFLYPSLRQAYLYDGLALTDATGVPISYDVRTKDFVSGDWFFRLDRIEFLAGGAGSVNYSTDGGATWLPYGVFNVAGGGYAKVRLFRQVTTQRIRFQFTGQSPFSLGYLGLWYRLEARY